MNGSVALASNLAVVVGRNASLFSAQVGGVLGLLLFVVVGIRFLGSWSVFGPLVSLLRVRVSRFL